MIFYWIDWFLERSTTNVISLDLYDTLITRSILSKKTIQFLSGSYLAREINRQCDTNLDSHGVSKDRARSFVYLKKLAGSPYYEPKIVDIYQNICERYFLSAATSRIANSAHDFEEFLEIHSVEILPTAYNFFQNAVKRGYKAVLISDMYLSKSTLFKIFERAGMEIRFEGAAYCTSKFAVRGLAQSLRADCASANVRVMLINPGPTATNFFDDLHFEPKPQAGHRLDSSDVAGVIVNALSAPRHVVQEEINVQPIVRAFQTKKP